MLRRKLPFLVTFLFLSFGLLFSTVTLSQSSSSYHMYLNANAGISQMFGDIQDASNHFSKLENETEFGYGARIGKYFSPVFAGHFQFLNANFKGAKSDDNVQFTSNLMEYQLGLTVNFLNLFFENKERRLSIYGIAGIGASFYESESTRITSDYVLQSYGKDGERKSAYAFPIGAGLDIRLAKKLYLNLETVMRLTNSDRLDGFESGEHNDAYGYTSVGISYNFWKKPVKEEIETPPVEFEKVVIDAVNDKGVNIVYDIPIGLESYDEFTLTSIIHKGQIDGKGELTQILPIGFTVMDTVIENARVVFKNYTMNIYWDELPSDSIFEVSYQVKLNNIFGTLPMTSILYLDKTGKEYKFKTDVFIKRKVEEVVIAEPEPEPIVKKVEFRIQVRASQNVRIPLQRLANRYTLREEIKEDYKNDWYRYSIGSFDTYFDAKDYRNRIIKEHGIRDAFIVAFYDGNRLDALSELIEVAPNAYPYKHTFLENGTFYRVQILALMQSKINTSDLKEIYQLEEEVSEEVYHNWRKYTVGKFTKIAEAKALLSEMKAIGLTDAFIVIYKNGERITYDRK